MNKSRQESKSFEGLMPGPEQMASSFSLHLFIEPKTEMDSYVHLNLDKSKATNNYMKSDTIHYIQYNCNCIAENKSITNSNIIGKKKCPKIRINATKHACIL